MHPLHLTRTTRIAATSLATAVGLTGCVANSSNPVIHINGAEMDNQRAQIDFRFENPGGRDLTINAIDYELSHGDMSIPVAEGTWNGTVELPAGDEASLILDIIFDQPPMEMDSTLLHFNGLLHSEDHTGFLGMSSMDLTETPFQLTVEAKERRP